jgi:tetratricopeptide (TPR) repeat protein
MRVWHMSGDGAISGNEKESASPLGDAQARKIAADLLCKKGRINEAIDAYLSAIEADPDHSPAYRGLGSAFGQAGRFEEALAVYREGLDLDPNDIEIHTAMARLLASLHRIDESLAAHARAASINPNAALTHEALGEIMLRQLDPKAAIESFRRAVDIDPSLDGAWFHQGVALVQLGKFEEAADCFRRVLALRPDSAFSDLQLVNTGKVAGAPEIERLTKLLSNPDLLINDRIAAGFALGKLLDDADRYDEAFTRYSEANLLAKQSKAKKGERFDPETFGAQVKQMVEPLTREFFEQRRDWGEPSELPVFIVGMPRSGTTLVQQIAASHPQVHGAGELPDIHEIAKSFGGTDVLSIPLGWKPGPVKEAAQRHLRRLQAINADACRIIDKMPRNVYRVGLIALLFPGARIIQCRRDARDNCLSYYFQLFAGSNIASFDLAHCAHEYLATERMLNHWRDVAPLRILDVQYETLVADLEGQSRRLISFLGLPWDPACLEFHRTRSAVFTSSVWQVRQPLYQRSVGRWKHYEKHLGPMLEVLGR